MQPLRFVYLLIYLFINHHASAQNKGYTTEMSLNDHKENLISSKSKHLNLFVITKRHKGKFDLATRFNVFRSKLKTLFCRKKFVAVIVKDVKQFKDKVIHLLDKHQAKIGTMWFDSHGRYAKGYSLFMLGLDEISHQTLKDSATIDMLREIADYSDKETKLIIGACYGGATYSRPSIDYKDTTNMNGDSLMIDLGGIFSQSKIYGCESWVMTKPGLFHKRLSVVGHPGRNLFHDICYRPVWENIGKWNEYNAMTGELKSSNPVTLDSFGNLTLKPLSTQQTKKLNQKIQLNLKKLQPGLYK